MSTTSSEETIWPGLAGKTALVTGASSGLGAHFARLLAGKGVKVTLAARRLDRISSICEEIAGAGGLAEPLSLDVADPGSVETALTSRSFDIVVNNAGTTLSAPALEHGTQDIDRILDTNLKGAFHVARVAAEAMVAKGHGGVIVNVASILGTRVAGNVSAYAASKAGLIQLSRALALEWARHGIRVNALCPGYIETELNRAFFASEPGQALIRRVPQRRLGQPSDLDGPLLLLVSDLGHFMTGTEIVADGGHLVSSL
ncbi:SDR family oxidoreductase [Sulfitobacter pseudonitzschiae]|jgi:NAD(P)-dependent dehydrogenase (short-subunit alcohol dehydrogenase family)|uniref:SDR family oxidoreductase n=2 Tax=Roseobacteraceae TaxID=2854170 RepID=A0A9Q2N0Q4_9RHOB|nr:SDR family oxidoreductase [Pseudosulfitobacter pseudonitzschiae]MDF3351367.1 SDR family oxidoreductase [Sulfitobacter sp. KE12]MDF3355039.1 SDR family oxidoreductase [Sulfitobacter sp. KE27]MDF3358687.1 SDR family oxidoreductase [Sulfitobacter sp. KE33]MDF3366111.1 SDR family oxidoreductase [Sulfitobacter sp. Ks34]MDF3369720.1 SDR family oxidoreductase [Sulfitobacter sp. Ks43]MDF3373369.1 SDR family oxidoreductase [Sulfitobacter sp. KS8]MDF3377006.1 SDR family oxidoreductase [Sulfitobacte|tara:strand:- start:16938 stop:17711 length:774 start_codon:yes stop_codon:yes gene_type:complete